MSISIQKRREIQAHYKGLRARRVGVGLGPDEAYRRGLAEGFLEGLDMGAGLVEELGRSSIKSAAGSFRPSILA